MKKVVIGGLGGSGTRLVARLVEQLGYQSDPWQNDSRDDLTTTVLLKNPRWHRQSSPEAIRQRVQLLLDLKDRRLSIGGLPHLWSILQRGEHQSFPWQNTPELFSYLFGKAPTQWLLKEPNTHIYCEDFLAVDPDLGYIHVMRHGLDMAFSGNTQQLYNWGHLFGITTEQIRKNLPSAQLEFWLQAVQKAKELAKKYEDRLLLLNFDQLIHRPVVGLQSIQQFCGSDLSEQQLQQMTSYIQRPASMARYRAQDLSGFEEEAIRLVKQFGFEINSSSRHE
ncbi:MAG: sulfotransferase [Bacteroidota bacterium]